LIDINGSKNKIRESKRGGPICGPEDGYKINPISNGGGDPKVAPEGDRQQLAALIKHSHYLAQKRGRRGLPADIYHQPAGGTSSLFENGMTQVRCEISHRFDFIIFIFWRIIISKKYLCIDIFF
jgi:hypothetical protein